MDNVAEGVAQGQIVQKADNAIFADTVSN
jgi:hypothetical protein